MQRASAVSVRWHLVAEKSNGPPKDLQNPFDALLTTEFMSKVKFNSTQSRRFIEFQSHTTPSGESYNEAKARATTSSLAGHCSASRGLHGSPGHNGISPGTCKDP